MEVISSVVLSPFSASIPLERVGVKLRLVLEESKRRQQKCVESNINVNLGRTRFSTAASRGFIIEPCSKARLVKSRVDRVDKSEAYRIILAYQQRFKVSVFLQEHDWNIPYNKVREEFPYLKYNLYRNLLKSRTLPATPVINNPQFPLNKSDNHKKLSQQTVFNCILVYYFVIIII